MAHSMIPIIQMTEYLERKREQRQDNSINLQSMFLTECVDFHGNQIHTLKCDVMFDIIKNMHKNMVNHNNDNNSLNLPK